MELIRIGKLLHRWWWVLALGLVIGSAGAYFSAKHGAPKYQSTLQLLVNQVQTPGLTSISDVQASQQLANTYGELLKGQYVLSQTVKQLHLPMTTSALGNMVDVSIVPSTQLLALTVTDQSPTRAAAIAKTIAQIFVKQVTDLQAVGAQASLRLVDQDLAVAWQQMNADQSALDNLGTGTGNSDTARHLQDLLSQDQTQYQQLLQTQQRLALVPTQAQSAVSVVEPPVVPSSRVASSTMKSVLLFGFLGLLIACAVVVIVEQIDDRIQDPEDLRAQFNLSPLASLAYVGQGQAPIVTEIARNTDGQIGEDLQLLRLNLESAEASGSRVLCVTSPAPGSGTSTVAANLAFVEARAGKRVVLIDANVRNPSLHRLFGLDNAHGLSGLVSSVRKVVLATLLEGPYGVQVLTAGPLAAPPFEILTSPRVANLIASLRSRADLIILDAAPISAANDAALLQRMVDGTILVVDAQRTGTRALSRALYALEVASANVIGVVLNKPKQRRWPLSHSRPMALARFEDTGRSQQTAPTDLQQFNA